MGAVGPSWSGPGSFLGGCGVWESRKGGNAINIGENYENQRLLPLGAFLEAFRTFLGSFQRCLGALWRALGLSWRPVGSLMRSLGASWKKAFGPPGRRQAALLTRVGALCLSVARSSGSGWKGSNCLVGGDWGYLMGGVYTLTRLETHKGSADYGVPARGMQVRLRASSVWASLGRPLASPGRRGRALREQALSRLGRAGEVGPGTRRWPCCEGHAPFTTHTPTRPPYTVVFQRARPYAPGLQCARTAVRIGVGLFVCSSSPPLPSPVARLYRALGCARRPF